MQHDSSIQDKKGRTCAMYWIQYVRTEPPEWMHHSCLIKDSRNRTCLKYWTEYVKTEEETPVWMMMYDTAADILSDGTHAVQLISHTETVVPYYADFDELLIRPDYTVSRTDSCSPHTETPSSPTYDYAVDNYSRSRTRYKIVAVTIVVCTGLYYLKHHKKTSRVAKTKPSK